MTEPGRPERRSTARSASGRRPGFGIRDPGLLALLASLDAAAVERVVWPGGLVLELAAYPRPTPLPEQLVTSVRCIVRVGERIVVCEAPDMTHVWPGGRREPGESYERTACREVREETGWLVDEHDLHPLGFLHYRLLDPPPDDHAYPHPDFLQLVYTAPAHRHADGNSAAWTDLAGWEQSHQLLTRTELATVDLTAAQRAFLAALGPRS
jgi:8-oxo-dGTP pyrophosphatase MutT (NUDIX family)